MNYILRYKFPCWKCNELVARLFPLWIMILMIICVLQYCPHRCSHIATCICLCVWHQGTYLCSRCGIYCFETPTLVIKRSLFIQTGGQIAHSDTPVSWLKSQSVWKQITLRHSGGLFGVLLLCGLFKNLPDSPHFLKQPPLLSCGRCTFYIMWTNKQASPQIEAGKCSAVSCREILLKH